MIYKNKNQNTNNLYIITIKKNRKKRNNLKN